MRVSTEIRLPRLTIAGRSLHEPLDNQIDLPLSPYIISNIPNVGKHEKRNLMKIKYITTQPRIIHLAKDKANEKPQQRYENENPEENTFGSSHNHHNCSLRRRTNSRNKFNSTKTKRNPNFATPLPSPATATATATAETIAPLGAWDAHAAARHHSHQN